MQESLFSPLWHYVSDLRPVLRPGVRIQRQRYRNETWYLLVDETTSRQHRINAAACQFIGRFDGRASVHELWSLLLEKFGERAPGQDEIVYTLQRLAEAEFVQFPGGADLSGLFRRSTERARRRSALVNPLALSVPLFDPSRFIAPLEPLGGWLFRPGAAVLLAILCLAALLGAAMNWPALHAHAATHLASAYYLGLAWASYPFIKLLHELAHALAVARWGGAVREFGITFLLFTPAPYTDASAAAAFRDRWQRAVVSAAGILVELGLGALALLAWLALERGVLSDLAFVVLFLCVASSVLFNGIRCCASTGTTSCATSSIRRTSPCAAMPIGSICCAGCCVPHPAPPPPAHPVRRSGSSPMRRFRGLTGSSFPPCSSSGLAGSPRRSAGLRSWCLAFSSSCARPMRRSRRSGTACRPAG